MRDNKKDRQIVAIFPNPKARIAITKYERLNQANFNGVKVSLIEVHPITGRTHQIRVHLKAIGNPVLGDKQYTTKEAKKIAEVLSLTRQFLHAESLVVAGKKYQAELPDDLVDTLKRLGIKNVQTGEKTVKQLQEQGKEHLL